MHPTHVSRSIARGAFALLMAASLAGCASAGKRYEQGVQLEQQGRPADAAQRYIDALRKDPSLADARARLLDAGQRAIADYLRAADAAEAGGRWGEAADALRGVDALRGDAGGVGVPLTVPGGYEQRRASTFARAVDEALALADAAARSRDFPGAVRLLDRVAERWTPSPEQRIRLARARYDAQLGWAQGEMDAGRYRSAWEHARAAPGPGGFDADARAAALQDEALRRGTARIAVLPVGATPNVGDAARASVVPELNDALAQGYWERSPQWIEVLSPVTASRLARQRGWWGREIQPWQAAQLGREMGARLAVAMTLDSIRRGEADVQTTRRAAKTRSGADTAYTVREGRLESWARVTWRVVDVEAWRGTADAGDVAARAGARFRRATYAGDWHDLALPQGERMLFQRDDEGYDRETVRELANGLSERLGRAVFDAVLRRVD